jgi:hypothetical protein
MAIAKAVQRPISPFKQASARDLESIETDHKKNKEILIHTINDLLVLRARYSPDISLLAYPASPRGTDDYLHYTASELDRFADEAARAYIAMGLLVKVRTSCYSLS